MLSVAAVVMVQSADPAMSQTQRGGAIAAQRTETASPQRKVHAQLIVMGAQQQRSRRTITVASLKRRPRAIVAASTMAFPVRFDRASIGKFVAAMIALYAITVTYTQRKTA